MKPSKDFENWILPFYRNQHHIWAEISFQRETKRGYQHRQDLKSVFFTSYGYFELKVESYYKEFNEIPVRYLHDLIFTFRQHFPKNGREEGINYFDDLLEQLIARYESSTGHSRSNFFVPSVQEHIETLPPQQEEKSKFHSPIALADLITHEKNLDIVEKIKIQYRNIKGKRLKLLLIAFQESGLLPKERIAKKFHNCCEKEFDWEISSYNAMNGYGYNQNTDNEELQEMKNYLKEVTKKK